MDIILETFRSFIDPYFSYADGDFYVAAVYAILNIITACILMVTLMGERFRLWPSYHKIGISFILIGLICKSYNQTQYLMTGRYINELDWPLQALDNVGIFIITVCYLYIAIKRKKK